MADISVINVGGTDYNAKDATARTNASTALTQLAYQETGNTASQAYSIIGTPINWKGSLYYTKAAVAKGATWSTSTNLTSAGNLGKLTSNIKTYVNGSGQLVFRDLTGADTVLPFSGTADAIAGYSTGNTPVASKTMTAKVGDMFFCGAYGGTITVNGGTIVMQKTDANEYPWVIAKATATSVTFSLSNGAETRFQIGQIR